MNRRNLLTAGPAAMVLAGAAAGGAAAAAPSPILDAARQIAAFDRQHEQADVPGVPDAALDRIWSQVWALESSILAATPATIVEAMVILMVAAGNLDTASTFEDSGATVNRAMHATARAAQFLAGTAGVTVEEFGGDLYLPARLGLAATGRAA